MEKPNIFLERFRGQSIILNGNRQGSDLNQPVIVGNPSNLQSHLMQIRGNENGIYFDSHHKEVPATLSTLKKKKKELQQRWEQHCVDQLKIGNRKPQIWPQDLQEEKLRLEARRMVANEEVRWLEDKLQEAQEAQSKSKGSLLSHPKFWGATQLQENRVTQIGPWSVEPDSEGLLRIADPDSPYNTMPVWRFKSEILKPMGLEFAHRHKQEETEAVAEARKRKKVLYPAPGKWNKENDLVEYENYSNETIKKLKQEN